MSKKLTTQELKELAHAHDLQPAALLAVLKVESSNSGFRADGKLKVLLEAHHVWRLLKLRDIDPHPLQQAHPECCEPSWAEGKKYYNHDSWVRHDTIVKYAQNHYPAKVESYRKAGLEAMSFGRPQIMGFNFGMVGYKNVDKMVADFNTGEKAQVNAMLKFIEHNHIMEPLRKHEWRKVAAAYNGSGQVDAYSTSLALAYAQAIKELT